MSKRIEVGMLVRVHPDPYLFGNVNHAVAGKIGRVVAYGGRFLNKTRGFHDDFWVTDIHKIPFSECLLEPINPDSELSTWEEVQKLTNWNPTKATA